MYIHICCRQIDRWQKTDRLKHKNPLPPVWFTVGNSPTLIREGESLSFGTSGLNHINLIWREEALRIQSVRLKGGRWLRFKDMIIVSGQQSFTKRCLCTCWGTTGGRDAHRAKVCTDLNKGRASQLCLHSTFHTQRQIKVLYRIIQIQWNYRYRMKSKSTKVWRQNVDDFCLWAIKGILLSLAIWNNSHPRI